MAYDALLFVSFGGPEKRDDVLPFLENVIRGRDVPRERLASVAEHYYHFDGKSPINDQNRALITALEQELAAHELPLPVYFGNRNWQPYLAAAMEKMRDDGVSKALAFVTSAYGSYSGCRQYQDNIAAARARVERAPQVDKLRAFFDHPGFVEPMVERVRAATLQLRPGQDPARLVFTAHSVPISMTRTGPYVAQLEQTCRLVATAAGFDDHDLVWQSRSGPPHVPWLEPDICDHLRTLAAQGTSAVVVVPIGFLSDHLEVLWDLDHEAHAVAKELGLQMSRAGTVGTHPRFVKMIRELVQERVGGAARQSLSSLGPAPDQCAPDCCVISRRPARTKSL